MDIASLVINCLALVVGVLAPLVLAVAYFIRKIHRSKCCGIESETDKEPDKKETV